MGSPQRAAVNRGCIRWVTTHRAGREHVSGQRFGFARPGIVHEATELDLRTEAGNVVSGKGLGLGHTPARAQIQ